MEKNVNARTTLALAAALGLAVPQPVSAQRITKEDIDLESLPEDVTATMEARDQFIASLPQINEGQEFFVEDVL
jgi:hypothetical protein